MTVIIVPVRAVYTAGYGVAAGGMSGEAFVNQPLILRWSPSTGGHLLILTPHTEI